MYYKCITTFFCKILEEVEEQKVEEQEVEEQEVEEEK
jgi:hypothetical protein